MKEKKKSTYPVSRVTGGVPGNIEESDLSLVIDHLVFQGTQAAEGA